MSLTFTALGVPADLDELLARAGIVTPTPIQAATLPDLLAGADVCAEAPTGSGKTLAFGIPLVARTSRARPGTARSLVLAPTRELADQIHRAITPLARTRGARVAAVYGGVGFGPQVTALRRGVEVLVACPGRLEDLLSQGLVDLGEVEAVVLDEADRMVDMGFLPAVERLLRLLPSDRQTMLLSATLDGSVDDVVRRHLRRPRRHAVERTAAEVARTMHLFWATPTNERKDVCADITSRAGRSIVFTRTKRGADRLARQLAARGVGAAAIHGDRSQPQRERALRQFHDGGLTALVATDVAARGIHVDDVACVVHFDPPASGADYVHRSGRTGRAGATGLVVTLAADDLRPAVRRIQRDLGLAEGFTRPDLTLVPSGRPPTPAASPAPAGTAVPGARRPDRAAPRAKGRGPTRTAGSGSGRGRPSEPGHAHRPSDRPTTRPERGSVTPVDEATRRGAARGAGPSRGDARRADRGGAPQRDGARTAPRRGGRRNAPVSSTRRDAGQGATRRPA